MAITYTSKKHATEIVITQSEKKYLTSDTQIFVPVWLAPQTPLVGGENRDGNIMTRIHSNYNHLTKPGINPTSHIRKGSHILGLVMWAEIVVGMMSKTNNSP